MDEQEYKEFLSWFSQASGLNSEEEIEAALDNLTDDEQDEVVAEYYRYKNNIVKAKEGTKCPKGMIPNYLKIGGKITTCGCKKPRVNLSEEALKNLSTEIMKCGGKMKDLKKTMKAEKGKKMKRKN